MEQLLLVDGWVRLREGGGEGIVLSAIGEPFPPPPDFIHARVVDEEGVRLWGTFHRYLEHDQRDEPRECLYLSHDLNGDQPLRHYIARLGGGPMGALSLILGQEAAGIYNVEVAPERRWRGVGMVTEPAVPGQGSRAGGEAVVAVAIQRGGAGQEVTVA